jgi:hypothetical protein
VRLWLSVIVYDLWNVWRRSELPSKIGNLLPTNLQWRLIKTSRHLIKYVCFYLLLLAERHLIR